MKKILGFFFHRIFIVSILIIIQFIILVEMIWKFHNYFVYFYFLSILVSFLALLYIINGRSNPGYKIAWLIPILVFPIFGGLFYILFGGNNLSKRQKKKMQSVSVNMKTALMPKPKLLEQVKNENIHAYNQMKYIEKYALCPVYNNTYTKYFSIGETYFERLLEELKKAKHYIFLEYFIIQEGIMWNQILEILKEKAKQGVDVRIIYDDMGCICTLPYKYDKKLKEYGIKCYPFNPMLPILSPQLNNRDHRKITIIDGHTGFTGGINLADEYINAIQKYGHWKDNGIMLKGEAVWSLTIMFLSMWEFITDQKEDKKQYHPSIHPTFLPKTDGYIQPYSDSPLDEEAIGETIYMNLINKAEKYVYITTPYLIIDNEMVTALCNAAKSGIKIKIITPGIADKKTVNEVTKAYYDILIESGIKIYEYTKGFIHAKTFIVDDQYATIGTVNLDYRSLYLHFECGVLLYQSSTIKDIKKDFNKTLEDCEEISLEKSKKIDKLRKLKRAFLRMFAPLM